ncbi:B3 domain-containing protein Os01g0723500 isoform X1 [Rosa chinensis]|uniref:B3 domain-containing protein Os01g0723500 isoform X1 n=1 Tax=Rosa chinensis TaxID=74649 RepID=UPI000D08D2AD|nr:B3 domain-containing protein Os01g0723500 isoform X1 [Rosa chinensis]XP_040364601.1 B3 domain-containing protein Os01g0723500 isoform X1 [Rosa chinensis]
MVRKNGVKEKRPSFFKVILPRYSTERLMIPPQFLKHLGKDLCSKATLSLNMSSQCSWNVKVTKTKKDVYFKDGWQEFLNNNSVDEGDFLVFTYEGKMHFSIAVFDRSCCGRVDFPNETFKESIVAMTTKRPCGRPRKDNSAADNTAKESAISFKSKFPHYKSTIKKTYCVYSIPTTFYREHLAAGKYEFAFLKISGGNKWYKVKLVPSIRTAFMSKGWAAFARDNQIKVGHVCIFELVKENKMVVHNLTFSGNDQVQAINSI